VDGAFNTPHLLQEIVDELSRMPEWLDDIPKHIEAKALTPVVRKQSVRKADCNNWIKKNNFITRGGIHKRKRILEARTPRTMVPLGLAQYQRHSIHLMSRVLNIRANASPFTLILDDLNQRAMPFIFEMVRRGLSRNTNVIILSFDATQYPPGVRNIPAHAVASGEQLMKDLTNALKQAKESLVIVDSLYDLLEIDGIDMSALFNLVAGKFVSTLVGVYHQDMLHAQDAHTAYTPQPLELLKYMATSVVTCKSFAHVLAAKAAKERSLPEPTHGLLQGAEGIVQCLDANDHQGIVLEAEFRRKSGRPESENYFLRNARASDYHAPTAGMPIGTLKQEFVTLLDMVPAYNSKEIMGVVNTAADDIESTFNLGLTEKQKEAREGVVLPYFDAQKGEGGEGGRILYDMGSEDDFDEEEDEI
jgi:elongator complex protein 5